MYELGPAYDWGVGWDSVPIGTKCANDEFPGSIFIMIRPGVLAWNGNGPTPVRNPARASNSDPIRGFVAAARWTRPVLVPRVLHLPMGA